MELREGYKLTELGMIPEDWIIKPVGEVFDFLRTGSNSRSELNSDGRVRYIHYGDIHTKWSLFLDVSRNDVPRIYEPKVKNLPSLQDGDLIMADASEDYSALGLAVEARNVKMVRAVAGLHTLLLRADKEILSDGFKGYIFAIKPIHDALVEVCTGTSVYGISKSALKGVPIFFPPTEKEQQAIATALSGTDALISSLDALVAKKRNIKQGKIQQLLTGNKRLAGFVGEWQVKELGTFGEFKNGINKNKSDFGFGYPFVNLLDVFSKPKLTSNHNFGLINSTLVERNLYRLRQGDVLFVRSSVKPEGVGLTSVIGEDLENVVFSGFLIRFRDFGAIETDYKAYCFREDGFRRRLIDASTVSANTNINQDALKALEITLPPTKEEQKAIAEILTDIDNEIQSLEIKRAKYQLIKQGMMQELLTGKKRLI